MVSSRGRTGGADAMIQAGERAAFLEEVLRSLSGFLERLDELRSKVLGAMIYPTLLTVMGVTVIFSEFTRSMPSFRLIRVRRVKTS